MRDVAPATINGSILRLKDAYSERPIAKVQGNRSLFFCIHPVSMVVAASIRVGWAVVIRTMLRAERN
jgi:hypothetical protein